MKATARSCHSGRSDSRTAKAAGLALARWGLGLMFLFFGLGKLFSLNAFVNAYLLPQFAKTWLPQWVLIPYGYILPFVEVGLGGLLLLGLARQAVLIATGLVLLSLTVGQIVLQQPPVVFQNMAYVFFTAALLFLGEHDTWVLPGFNPRSQETSGAPPAPSLP